MPLSTNNNSSAGMYDLEPMNMSEPYNENYAVYAVNYHPDDNVPYESFTTDYDVETPFHHADGRPTGLPAAALDPTRPSFASAQDLEMDFTMFPYDNGYMATSSEPSAPVTTTGQYQAAPVASPFENTHMTDDQSNMPNQELEDYREYNTIFEDQGDVTQEGMSLAMEIDESLAVEWGIYNDKENDIPMEEDGSYQFIHPPHRSSSSVRTPLSEVFEYDVRTPTSVPTQVTIGADGANDLAGTGGSRLSLPTSANLFWSSPVHQGWDSPVVRTRQVINSADQTGDYELCGVPNHYQYYTAVPVFEGPWNETVDKGTQVDMDLLDSEAAYEDEDGKVEDSLTDFEGEVEGKAEGKERAVSPTPTAADAESAPLSYAITSETKNTELDCEPKVNNLVSDDQNINSTSEAGPLRRSKRVEARKLQAENIDAEFYVKPEDNATVSNDQETNPAPETEPLRRSGRVEARKLQTENTDADFDFDVNPEDDDIVSNDEDANSTPDVRSLRRNKRAEVRKLQAAALSARLQTATASATASSAAEGSRRSTRNQTRAQKEQVQIASSAAEGLKRSTRSQAAAQRELEEKERMESNVGLRTRSHRRAGLC